MEYWKRSLKKKSISSAALIVALLIAAQPAYALPRFAILTGMECLNCHVNPTGGELRNSYGSSDFVDDHLRLVPAHDNEFEFNPKLGEDIILGGDVRFQYLYDGQTKNSTFQSMQGSIYSSIHLFSSTRLYVNYDFVNSAYEAYGLFDFNGGDTFIKVGAFEPSYGVRLDDHTAYTRGGNFGLLQGIPQLGLIFYPDYRDLGIEVGSKVGDFMITVDATNGQGSSNFNFTSQKAAIGRIEYLLHSSINIMVGASGYYTSSFKMYGVHGGLGFAKRLSLLGEFDWAQSLPTVLPVNTTSNAAFAEASYEITNGLFAVGRFDYFKEFAAGPVYYRYIFGGDIYPIPHLDLMPQIRFNTTNVVGTPGYSRPVLEALIQSHIYF